MSTTNFTAGTVIASTWLNDVDDRTYNDAYNVKNYGAIGDGTTDDTSAVQACVTAAGLVGKAVYFPSGYYLLSSTVTITKKWSFFGDGDSSVIYVTDATIAAFTFSINTTSVSGWTINNLSFIGPVTTNVLSCALRFTGDSTAFVQYGQFRGSCTNFNAFVKDEKSPRTTASGLEAMLNWNRWHVTLQNQSGYGYWGTQGSGTGNQWDIVGVLLLAGSAMLFFDGSGCVVGDIIAHGHWGCQASGGVGVKVGASTVYRAQIDMVGVQFDANCDIPLLLSATGAVQYTNITIAANNLGGNTVLGANVQPLRNSVIQDRDVSNWETGKAFTTNATGLTTSSIFTIDFASWGSGNFKIVYSGLVGGVGAGVAVGEFDIVEGTGSLTVTSILNRLTGPANCAAITITTSGTTATVKATYTASSTGTTFNATIQGRGDRFKISRV